MEDLVSFEPTSSVLFVGEGNFSFSNLLTEFWQQNLIRTKDRSHMAENESSITLNNVYSTCYEDQPVSELAKENIGSLRQRGVNVYLGIDATKSFEDNKVKNAITYKSFSKIIFMFPHVGGKMKIKKNRDLIRRFASNMVNYLDQKNKEAMIIITLCGGQGGTPFDPIQRAEPDTWQVIKTLSTANLQLVAIGMFDIENYIDAKSDSYTSYGYRGGNKKFHVEKGVVHVFQLSKRICDLKSMSVHKSSVYCQHQSLEDVKEEYVRRKVVQLYDQTSYIGQKLKHFIQYARKVTDDNIIFSSTPLRTVNLNSTLETKLEQLTLSEDDVSKSVTIEIILQEIFEMDFKKCPVETYILVINCDAIRPQLIDKFSSALLRAKNNLILLFDLAKIGNYSAPEAQQLGIESHTYQNVQWQTLWSGMRSLYPPKYTHCLSFWLPESDCNNRNYQHLDEKLLAPILWCCGYDTVISCEIVDVYKENERISNTMKIEYQSYNFALSSELALAIQVNSIAQTLKTLFCIEIR